ncbi:MAG TPA: protein kinase [Burkholderiales bacterium]|nr:protein kinase [Burkholderiales bacterium]
MEPRKFGRYEVLGEIGKGAMGVVYRAHDPLLDRMVAVKTINMELAQEEMAEYEARFYQEARAAGGLNHPNIVTVYDIGKSGHVAYMAMEYLEGAELRSLLAGGRPLAPAQALDIAAQIATGLAYAHERGVVHRDVKPANIMLTRNGTVKITDFGIARMRSSGVRTQTGVVLGSPRYLSPEQVVGKRADPRSDIFALGVILYEMVTGRAPFTGEDVSSIMFQILNFVPPSPGSLVPGVPEMLDFIVAKALAKPPEDRYADASELARDLRECRNRLAAGPSAAQPGPRPAQASFDPEQAAELLVRSSPNTRAGDAEPGALEPAPTLGLSRAFNSLDATLKLAAQTGLAQEMDDIARLLGARSGGHAAAPQPAYRVRSGAGWSARDRLIFAASVAGATIVGAFIVLA